LAFVVDARKTLRCVTSLERNKVVQVIAVGHVAKSDVPLACVVVADAVAISVFNIWQLTLEHTDTVASIAASHVTVDAYLSVGVIVFVNWIPQVDGRRSFGDDASMAKTDVFIESASAEEILVETLVPVAVAHTAVAWWVNHDAPFVAAAIVATVAVAVAGKFTADALNSGCLADSVALTAGVAEVAEGTWVADTEV